MTGKSMLASSSGKTLHFIATYNVSLSFSKPFFQLLIVVLYYLCLRFILNEIFRFHLYKENKDSQEALGLIGKMLGIKVHAYCI